MRTRYAILLSVLLLFTSCDKDFLLKLRPTPPLTIECIIQIDTTQMDKPEQSLETICNILERRLAGFPDKYFKIKTLSNDKIQVLISEELSNREAETLLSNAEIGFHVVHSSSGARDKQFGVLLSAIDSVQFEASRTEEILSDSPLEVTEIVSLLSTNNHFPENSLSTIDSILSQDEVANYLGQTKIICAKDPLIDFRSEKALLTESGQKQFELYQIDAKSSLNNEELKNVTVGKNEYFGGYSITLTFSAQGAKDFEQVTRRNINKRLAITFADKVLSAPNIKERISGGSATISGSFSEKEAKLLAAVINSGALRTKLKIHSIKPINR